MNGKRFLCALIFCAVCVCLGGCAEKISGFVESFQEYIGEETGQPEEPDRVLLLEDLDKEVSGEDSPLYFAYESLTDAEKIWYEDMDRIVRNVETDEELSEEGLDRGLTESDIDKIFQCVLCDHPEYFYVEGYTYTTFTKGEEVVKMEFSGTYSLDADQVSARRTEIRDAAEKILAGISADASDYDKIRYIYETVVFNTDYDLSAPDNQNIYSVLVQNRSVCQGYAKTVQYLLQELGVECTLVTGTVDGGERHAWNLVKADGAYYYVDATWGDPSFNRDGMSITDDRQYPEISYDYLCITTEQLLRTHTIESVLDMPVCTSRELNYYVLEGMYFIELDKEQLQKCFEQVRDSGKDTLTLKCADGSVYEEMLDFLITQHGIFDYLGSAENRVTYSQNEKQLSLTFWVTNE